MTATDETTSSATTQGLDAGASTGSQSTTDMTETTSTSEADSGVPTSAGCDNLPSLMNSPAGAGFQQNTITVGATSRQFIVRWPEDYDESHAYRLVLGLHGAGGSGGDIAQDYFGLWELAEGSTIFVALSADGGFWSAESDVDYVDEVLELLAAELCIDTSRVILEGFSQGAAMAWTLACSRPSVYRAVVGHSGGGVTAPTTCEPIAYLGSLGLDEANNSQVTQTDRFAQWNGCSVETLPTAPNGGHVCTPYPGCPADNPVVWCSFDGGHTPSPSDEGQSRSWMPETVWQFIEQF
jgi:pimeloyl-ACP methyl ester carboxylesterase